MGAGRGGEGKEKEKKAEFMESLATKMKQTNKKKTNIYTIFIAVRHLSVNFIEI